ncbi:hypothetical protein [Rhizomonospora bruguierae]|uniref:hypothetical protein n=1 Tax=Rhizomonospora bruguierae TaxID=1581705 RepID=UPI001BCF7E82|nr:hypothetical protein [Micromonospora sp. NBRC 107566]
MNAVDLEDDALLGRLSRLAFEADPLPEEVLAAARAAFETRDLDGRLARLIGDSLDVEEYGVYEAVRSEPGAARLLSFAGGGVQVDLEVAPSGAQVALIGQVTGAAPAGCALERPGGAALPLAVDDLGRFLADPVERGPIRLRLRSAAGSPVLTAWVAV